MKYLVLRLPIGVTDNRRHCIARYGRRLIDTGEYRAWKEEAVLRIRPQLPKKWKPLQASEADQLPYRVQVILPNRRSDAANYDKGLRDVLKLAGVWEDDKWAMPQFFPAIVDAKHAGIFITLPLTPEARAEFWPT